MRSLFNVPWPGGGQGRHLLRQIQQSLKNSEFRREIDEENLGTIWENERVKIEKRRQTCKELWVDGSECGVPAGLAHLLKRQYSFHFLYFISPKWKTSSSTHPDIVVAFFSFLICAENVAEF